MTTQNDNGNGTKNGFVEYKKTQSRKWRLVLLVLLTATISMLVPPLISAWLLKAAKTLVLLSGTEWVSVVALVVSAYFGANVLQKHVEKKTAQATKDKKSGVGAVTTVTTESSESNIEIKKTNESGEA